MMKQIFVPVAAFAITATSVAAFSDIDYAALDVDLTTDQVSALEEAETIRQTAEEQAKAVLEEAGIDEETMRSIHEASREAHHAAREVVMEAIANNDYAAFVAASADDKMAEFITSEADFQTLVEAHELREAGDTEGATALMESLGLPTRGPSGMDGHRGGPGPRGDWQSATDDTTDSDE